MFSFFCWTTCSSRSRLLRRHIRGAALFYANAQLQCVAILGVSRAKIDRPSGVGGMKLALCLRVGIVKACTDICVVRDSCVCAPFFSPERPA